MQYGRQAGKSDILQAHHIIQDQWAKGNSIKGYDRGEDAPSILLEKSNVRHSIITTLQNRRRDKRIANNEGIWSTTLEEEFKNARSDLQAAGVPQEVIEKAIRAARLYFLF